MSEGSPTPLGSLSADALPARSAPLRYELKVGLLSTLLVLPGLSVALVLLGQQAWPYSWRAATMATLLISSAFTGFAAYRMRSDPKSNRHGPPTLQTRADEFS